MKLISVIGICLSLVFSILGTTVTPVLAQENSICGWVDFVSLPPGGQVETDFVMTYWDTGDVFHLAQPLYLEYDYPEDQHWADQFINTIVAPGNYRIYNPIREGDWITRFSQIESVSECQPVQIPTVFFEPTFTFVPPPEDIPLFIATEAPVPALPVFVVTGIQVEPGQVSVFEQVKVKVFVENTGVPLNLIGWEYTGELFLEDDSGRDVERHPFSRGDASSILPVIEGGQLNFNKWVITLKVRFSNAVSNGKIIVNILPGGQESTLRVEGPLTVNIGSSGLTCTTVVANKLMGSLLPEEGKDFMTAVTAGLQSAGCGEHDIACSAPPMVKAFLKVVGRSVTPGKIIVSIWGVFETDALAVCRDPVVWMQQLVREFNRQKVSINLNSIHSPMLILVTNSQDQRVGFVSDEEIVTEIPDSRVIEWEGDKYVVYPAENDIHISLTGTGNGIASLSVIDGFSRKEVSYSSFQVSENSSAQLDLVPQQSQLVVDNNGDGNIDEVRNPVLVEDLRLAESPLETPPPASPSRGLCNGSLGVLVLPFLLTFTLKRFNKIKL